MIISRVEFPRRCGFRKKGGMYFVSAGEASACCKLPFPLDVCPHCNQGIKQNRGFMWISTDLFDNKNPENIDAPTDCIMSLPGKKIGLMWVGAKFYPDPLDFRSESMRMGISKRIAQIPRDFKIGETWIALAHPRALDTYDFTEGKREFFPGIFALFRPTAIEYIIKGTETEAELKSLEDRGLTLVDSLKVEDPQLHIF